MYGELGDSLEGVIYFEETDKARGEFAIRTRHRVIAEIVWKRCGESGLKEHFLQRAMELLNFTYRLDKLVFDKFVRTDEVVDTFRSFDAKAKFFETACRREPENPYVLQHYARMLYRDGQLNSALAQIDRALTMNEGIRALRHTRGTILAGLADAAESEDVARKWMLQSDHEFRKCITMNPADDYGYGGLASVYLDWAKKVRSEEESADYIAKAEFVISEGLRNVKNRESLWIASAKVQEFLGNNPGQIQKLAKAVAENTTSVTPRYLLGRAYRRAGEPQKCKDVLEPIIKSNFAEYRSFVEYTRAMLELGEPFKKCSAVLLQARLDGLSDPRFIGLLGGLLFMDTRFDEAEEVFAESIKQGLSFDERIRTQYRPRDPITKKPVELAGRVVSVKPGFVFVQTDPYPNFLATTTRVDGTVLQRGMKVRFHPTFSARGSFAADVVLDV